MMSGLERLALFRWLLLSLCEREALGFSAACRAFLNVVSALAVSHKALTSPFLRHFQAVSLRAGKKPSRRETERSTTVRWFPL
jgi:hypothetical protein